MLDFLRRMVFGPTDFMPLDKRDDPYADMDEVCPSWLDDEPDELEKRQGLAPDQAEKRPPTRN